MLARSSVLRHPSGLEIKTPILVPSFSSKGFRFNAKGHSEAQALVKFAEEFLTHSMLISAYDIHHNHVPGVNYYRRVVDLVFLDSGGYELLEYHDLSTSFHYPNRPKAWSRKAHLDVVRKWPKTSPCVIVSFDSGSCGKPVREQLKDAKALTVKFPSQLHCFLIKPEDRKSCTFEKETDSLLTMADDLRAFNLIGVTEKELGNSLLERLIRLSNLRMTLDRINVLIPIHVFGSLDPLTSFHYFLAGAEVFDGLTWLRFSYADGLALYAANKVAMDGNIETDDDQARLRSAVNNIYYLDRLRLAMQSFLVTRDFAQIPHGAELRKNYELLISRTGGTI